MNRRDRKALSEIVRLCDLAAELVTRGHEWFFGDPAGVPGLAVESLIVKIGENVARLSPPTIDAHPQVPWSQIKRMRDLMAHHYEGTSYTRVWNTMTRDIPQVRIMITAILEE